MATASSRSSTLLRPSSTAACTVTTAAELDATHTGEALPLVSPPGYGKRQILIFRTDGADLLRVVERTEWPSGRESNTRLFDVTVNMLVPTYAVAPRPRQTWTVDVQFHRQDDPVTLAFASRALVFRLQFKFTGYWTMRQCYENVKCVLTHKPHTWSRAQLEKGDGEIQYWLWPKNGGAVEDALAYTIANNPPRAPSIGGPTLRPSGSSPSSSPANSRISALSEGLSLVPETVRQSDMVSVDVNQEGQEVLIAEFEQPPLLVAMIQDNRQYKMFKTDVTNLNCQISTEDKCQVILSNVIRQERFDVRLLRREKADLATWNLCALAPEASDRATERLRATFLTLTFRRSEDAESFSKRLGLIQAWRRESAGERNMVIGKVLDGGVNFAPASPTASSSSSSMRSKASMSPRSSAAQRRGNFSGRGILNTATSSATLVSPGSSSSAFAPASPLSPSTQGEWSPAVAGSMNAEPLPPIQTMEQSLVREFWEEVAAMARPPELPGSPVDDGSRAIATELMTVVQEPPALLASDR